MAKGYYETGGSDYLNDSPLVKRASSSGMQAHNHDERYYTKEETNESIRQVDSRVSQQQTEIENKAPIDHEHTNATAAKAGFMSESDKQKLDELDIPTSPTSVYLTASAGQSLNKDVYNKILFDRVLEDTKSLFMTENGVIKIKEDGMYLVSSKIETSNTAAGTTRIALQVSKNNVPDISLAVAALPAATYGGISGTTVLPLKMNDLIAIHVWTDTAAIQTRGRGALYEYVKLVKIW